MEMKDLIQRIGYFRNKANLSARELSLRIGKHEGYINKLESKDFNLPTTMLLEIIETLEITPKLEEIHTINDEVLSDYTYEMVGNVANKMIKLDLDDGVIINYAKFVDDNGKSILAKIK